MRQISKHLKDRIGAVSLVGTLFSLQQVVAGIYPTTRRELGEKNGTPCHVYPTRAYGTRNTSAFAVHDRSDTGLGNKDALRQHGLISTVRYILQSYYSFVTCWIWTHTWKGSLTKKSNASEEEPVRLEWKPVSTPWPIGWSTDQRSIHSSFQPLHVDCTDPREYPPPEYRKAELITIGTVLCHSLGDIGSPLIKSAWTRLP